MSTASDSIERSQPWISQDLAIAMPNAALGLVGLNPQQVSGWVFAPIAWSMGVPGQDASAIGIQIGGIVAARVLLR